jgi:fumarate reductase subunit C
VGVGGSACAPGIKAAGGAGAVFREPSGTGLAVAGYVLVLLAGIMCLAHGEFAYTAWLHFLATPGSLALHLVFLVAMMLHVLTWFQIMPKTMPRVVIHDQAVPHKLPWASASPRQHSL